MKSHELPLRLLPETFAVCRFPPDEPVPPLAASAFVSITRTNEELSLVCIQSAAPTAAKCDLDWRCIRVAGVLPFDAVGVLASLVNPLADAGIPVFATSTFDTDYLLVRGRDLGRAVEALRIAGHFLD